ncbi:hypothetical protein [Rhodopirellula bahusiensis]|uniref:hypothetical protein n=1 Tax=Rhodopirellula bahusiensis TaxID=2014065 RepID=UPI0032997E60
MSLPQDLRLLLSKSSASHRHRATRRLGGSRLRCSPASHACSVLGYFKATFANGNFGIRSGSETRRGNSDLSLEFSSDDYVRYTLGRQMGMALLGQRRCSPLSCRTQQLPQDLKPYESPKTTCLAESSKQADSRRRTLASKLPLILLGLLIGAALLWIAGMLLLQISMSGEWR